MPRLARAQPIATALFANSRSPKGAPTASSLTAATSGPTRSDRTGMLPFAFEDGFGFEAYVDYAARMCRCISSTAMANISTVRQSSRDFLKGKLPALPGEKPSIKDWQDHLTTIFPEVRLKTYLEMRGADAGPWSRSVRSPRFGPGFRLRRGARSRVEPREALESEDRRSAFVASCPHLASTPIRGQNARDIAQAPCSRSRARPQATRALERQWRR